MKVFEYVVLLHPDTGEKKRGDKVKLISDGVQHVLAKDQNVATMLAARKVPDEFAEKLDQVEIAIRPF